MTDRPANPHQPLSIDELLTLIDSDALAPQRGSHQGPSTGRPDSTDAKLQALQDALQSAPRLKAWVEIITDDRKALQQLASSDALMRAPADMLSRVEAQLERDALLGLQPETSARPQELQTYKLPPQGPSVVSSPWFRFASVAAGVALAVGGTIIALQITRPGTPPNSSGSLASGDTSGTGGVFILPVNDPRAHTEQPPAPPDALAVAADRRARTVIRVTTSRPLAQVIAALERFDGQTGSLVTARLDLDATDAGSSDPGSRDRSLAPARVALAAAHAADVARTAIPAGAFARAPRPPRSGPDDYGANAPGTRAAPAAGSASGGSDAAGFPPAGTPAAPLSRDTLVVGVNASTDWIEIITKRLAIDGVKIELIPADSPVTLAAPTDLSGILWWEQPAASWGPRVGVPIIVDRR